MRFLAIIFASIVFFSCTNKENPDFAEKFVEDLVIHSKKDNGVLTEFYLYSDKILIIYDDFRINSRKQRQVLKHLRKPNNHLIPKEAVLNFTYTKDGDTPLKFTIGSSTPESKVLKKTSNWSLFQTDSTSLYLKTDTSANLLLIIADVLPHITAFYQSALSSQINNFYRTNLSMDTVGIRTKNGSGVFVISPSAFNTKYESSDFKWLVAQHTERVVAEARADTLLAPIAEYVPYTAHMNIVLTSLKQNKTQILNQFKTVRDSLQKAHWINEEDTNRYLKTTDFHIINESTPLFNNIPYFKVEGNWEVNKGQTTGTYIAYILLSEFSDEAIYLEGFINAPMRKKMNLLRHLDAILQRAKII